jgi:hypothetical protein
MYKNSYLKYITITDLKVYLQERKRRGNIFVLYKLIVSFSQYNHDLFMYIDSHWVLP